MSLNGEVRRVSTAPVRVASGNGFLAAAISYPTPFHPGLKTRGFSAQFELVVLILPMPRRVNTCG